MIINPYMVAPAASSGSGPHIYWRLLVTSYAGMGSGAVRFAEVSDSAGYDSAPVFADIDPYIDSDSISHPALNVRDQDPNSWWGSEGGEPFIGMQYPVPVVIDVFYITSASDSVGYDDISCSITVQSSDDGSVWAEEFSGALANSGSLSDFYSIDRP